MATYTSYDVIGQKESVADIITDISPTDTPAFTLFKTEKISARIHSWLEDDLASAGVNAAVEGANFSAGSLNQATTRTNNTQILTKTFAVTATQDTVATYGRAKETAYQLGKALKEIKRDLELAIVGVDQAAVTGSASAARKFASMSQQISTSVDAGGNSTDPLTEAKILTLGQTLYTAGSEPSVLMIKPADSTIVAGFAASSNRQRDLAEATTLVNVIDVLVTPFGQYRTVLNRHQLSTHAFLIDPAMFKTLVLRPFFRVKNATVGDAETHSVVGEYSLKHMNFADSGMITGLS